MLLVHKDPNIAGHYNSVNILKQKILGNWKTNTRKTDGILKFFYLFLTSFITNTCVSRPFCSISSKDISNFECRWCDEQGQKKFFTGQFLRYSKGNLMTINNMSIKIKVCGSLHRNSMLVTHDNSDNVLTVNAS